MEEIKKEIKLKINDSELKGNYANQISVMHSKYDFVIDYITMFPPEAIVSSRIVTNPVFFKKMYNIIGANIKKYEEQYGIIEITDEIVSDFSGKVN